MKHTNTNRKPSSLVIAVDENDRKPSYAFKWEMFKIVISMVAYLCDISSDVYSIFYYYSGFPFYSLLTAIFLVFPGIFMTCLKTKWYAINEDDSDTLIPHLPKCFTVFCRIFCIWPLARFVDTLRYGFESLRANKIQDYPKMERCYKQMLIKDANTTYLRLIECFFETAPQLVLKFYILAASHGDDSFTTQGIWQVTKEFLLTAISISSMSLTLMNYERSKSEKKKWQLSTLFLAYFFWMSGRVIVLGFIAAYHISILKYSICFSALPVLVQLLYKSRNSEEKFSFEKVLLYVIAAFIHIFVFINERNEISSPPQLIYLIIMLIETVAFVIIGLTHGKFDQIPSAPLPQFYFGAMLLGLFLLVLSLLPIYYYYYHDNIPRKEIATAVQSPQTPQSATLTDDEGAISQIIAETNFAAINCPTLPSVEIAVKKML